MAYCSLSLAPDSVPEDFYPSSNGEEAPPNLSLSRGITNDQDTDQVSSPPNPTTLTSDLGTGLGETIQDSSRDAIYNTGPYSELSEFETSRDPNYWCDELPELPDDASVDFELYVDLSNDTFLRAALLSDIESHKREEERLYECVISGRITYVPFVMQPASDRLSPTLTPQQSQSFAPEEVLNECPVPDTVYDAADIAGKNKRKRDRDEKDDDAAKDATSHPRKARFRHPPSEDQVVYEKRCKSLTDYPLFETPVPDSITIQELLQKYPNHLRDEYLDDFIQHHYSASDIWEEVPQRVKDLWLECGVHKRQNCNMFEKRLQHRKKVLGEEGMINLFLDLETHGPRRQCDRTCKSRTSLEFHQKARDILANKACREADQDQKFDDMNDGNDQMQLDGFSSGLF